jgi:uncharacterized membrane-anchored protein YitT (DUF2179 family)
MNYRSIIKDYLLILLGSLVYALSTVLFVFPNKLLLGGTSGISVILTSFIPFSPGIISTVINLLLIVIAFLVLGRDMAVKTLVGSMLTALFIGLLEAPLTFDTPLITNYYISAFVGAAAIAVASGVMFYVKSSSGGTDIIALIVQKYSRLRIGRALLVTDTLIVIVGGILAGRDILISSIIGLLVKTLGIDLVIRCIKAFVLKEEKATINENAG